MDPQTLLLAAANGNVEILENCLKANVSVESKDASGFTSLQFAVYNGHLNCVKKLIEYGADGLVFDTKNYNNFTPLHFASTFGKLEIVQSLLLNSKQNLHVLNGFGQKPSDIASTLQIKSILLDDEKKDKNLNKMFNIHNKQLLILIQQQ